MSSTPTVLSNESLTNSQDPKWVAEGLAYWMARKPTSYLSQKRINTELEMFRYWAGDLGIEVPHAGCSCVRKHTCPTFKGTLVTVRED